MIHWNIENKTKKYMREKTRECTSRISQENVLNNKLKMFFFLFVDSSHFTEMHAFLIHNILSRNYFGPY